MDFTTLATHIEARRSEGPTVVGISGYCGAGKSTLARRIVAAIDGAVRVRGDDFLDPSLSHQRSADWAGVERSRLREELLEPFRGGRGGVFRRYDWSQRSLGEPEPVPVGDLLVVDLIGLFHPEVLPALDVRVWLDTDLETATAQGMARDARLGRDHVRLWNDVWVPNERDFERRFDPRHAEGVLLVDVRG